jgi:transcriptional regulator with XRE-family HTH domain
MELRAIRERADLTQRELAARLSVTHSWIAKVEMGERRLDLIEFCRIVIACGEKPEAAFDRIWRKIEDSMNISRRKGGRHK